MGCPVDLPVAELLTVGAIDLGSNTLKLTVARLRPEGLEVLAEAHEITRIGEGLDQRGALLPAAMERTLAALHRFRSICLEHKASKIVCVGTAGLRGAANAPEFLSRVLLETGIDVEVIHGLREAELAFRAPAAQFGPGPVVVFDLGGRSTEIVVGSGGKLESRISIEMGSVRLTERFFRNDPPRAEELEAVAQRAAAELANAPDADASARLVGVSGSVISMLGLVLGIDDVEEVTKKANDVSLRVDALDAELHRLAGLPARERVFGTTLPVGRADVIVAGAVIMREVMRRYRKDVMFVTHRGVRYGLLEEQRLESRILA